MAGRSGSVPNKPTDPVLSLSKLKGKRNSVEAISIHFNAASRNLESDDEDIVTIDTKAIDDHQTDDSESVTSEKPEAPSDRIPVSHSAPVSEMPTPDVEAIQKPACYSQQNSATSSVDASPSHPAPRSQLKDGAVSTPEKSSLLSGIREKLQDRIPEPFTDFIGKLEKFSNDTDDASKERRMRKSESVDERKLLSNSMKKSESLDSARTSQVAAEKRGLFTSSSVGGSAATSRNPSVESEPSIEPLSTPASERSGHSRNNSFELVDDFFGTEPFEDFDGSPSAAPPSPSPSPTVKHSAAVKPARAPKLAKTKLGGERVSYSSVLHSKPEDTGYHAEDEEEFFDPCEESPTEDTKSHPLSIIPQTSWDLWQPYIPSQRVLGFLVGGFSLLVLVLPSFLSGLLIGGTFIWLAMIIYQILYLPVPAAKKLPVTATSATTDMLRPELKLSKNEPGKFKGWMNHLTSYSVEDYHISQTQSVYIQLEGESLRVQRPKTAIAKRAMFDEQTPPTVFVHQRHYKLKGSSVYLLPEGLCSKRLWSKKYPIVISLAEHVSLDRRLSNLSTFSAPAAIDIAANEDNGTIKSTSTDSIESELEQPEQRPHRDSSAYKGKHKEIPEVMYLFARTCRQKEEWFRRFQAAAKGEPLPTHLNELMRPRELPQLKKQLLKHRRQGSLDSPVTTPLPNSTDPPSPSAPPSLHTPTEQLLRQYLHYMAVIMPEGSSQRSKVTRGSGRRPQLSSPDLGWFNALVGRVLWDFLREEYWASMMKEKVNKKLAKIHVPYFIDELAVCDIDLGSEVPQVQRLAKAPYLDEKGLWMFFDVTYHGGLQMSLETKVNLMKLKKYSHSDTIPEHVWSPDGKRSAVIDPDEEDSAESSTDEDIREEFKVDNVDETGNAPPSKSKKLLRIVDKIASSKYFQQATEYKYIKRAMQGVSNTRLMLAVELNRLVGTLVVNIPPPPSDRLWWGFEPSLDLVLTARPKVGERAVSVTLVTDWIQKKLCTEFQRVLVMPNMDDLLIPLMCDKLNPFPSQDSASTLQNEGNPSSKQPNIEETSPTPSPSESPRHSPSPSYTPTSSPLPPSSSGHLS